MNKYAILAVVVVGLMLASGFAGMQYNEAEHAKQVTALNKTIYDLLFIKFFNFLLNVFFVITIKILICSK
mgnify:CR=1 FL=1